MVKVSKGTINTPAIKTSEGEAIAESIDRLAWSIQNVGTNPLFVRLGGTASNTVFHYILKGGTGDSDGTGGSLSSNDVAFYGSITVAGTSPKYVVMSF